MSIGFKPDDLLDLGPLVEKTAKQSAFRYRYRLAQMPAIDGEDFIGVGWRRLIEKHQALDALAGSHRENLARKMCHQAIDDEMKRLQESVTLVPMTSQGTMVTGRDSSYDGGNTVFGNDDFAPASIVPSQNFWNPPSLWNEWQKMNLPRRTALLTKTEAFAIEEKSSVQALPHVNNKWRDIPSEVQDWIERYWMQTAKGVSATNRNAVNTQPRNPFGFARHTLPHPNELVAITPPKLRAIALFVYRLELSTKGLSIKASEIADALPKKYNSRTNRLESPTERTVLRQHDKLIALWSRYIRASLDEKSAFARYDVPAEVIREFALLPEGSVFPAPSAALDQLMMAPACLADLYKRMETFHTDFSEAACTPTIVEPKEHEIILMPSGEVIHHRYETRVPESENHTRTIDTYWNGREWAPIHAKSDKGSSHLGRRFEKRFVIPTVWLHDWSEHQDLFGDKPTRLLLTTQRTTSVPLYPEAMEEKHSYCECSFCQHLRKEMMESFSSWRNDADDSALPPSVSPIVTGMLHGQSSPVTSLRNKETHYLGRRNGHEVWGVVETGLNYGYFVKIPRPRLPMMPASATVESRPEFTISNNGDDAVIVTWDTRRREFLPARRVQHWNSRAVRIPMIQRLKESE